MTIDRVIRLAAAELQGPVRRWRRRRRARSTRTPNVRSARRAAGACAWCRSRRITSAPSVITLTRAAC